jgi:hypothetical protein
MIDDLENSQPIYSCLDTKAHYGENSKVTMVTFLLEVIRYVI